MDERLKNPKTTNTNAQNQRLGRGVNMGNMLEAPRGGWNSEELVLDPAYFSMIHAKGFDSVRIPVRWSDYAAQESPYTIEPAFLDKVEDLVQAALDAKLAVVLNVHHYEEIFTHPVDQQDRLMGLWQQIAERFQSAPSDLMVEVLNEPHGELTSMLWNPMMKQAIQVIRDIDPARTILVGPADWNGVNGLKDLEIPSLANLILTVHYYNPMQFTHQGASWVNNSGVWMGTTWEGTEEEKQAILNDFNLVDIFARAHNIAVNLGEFGAYERADMDARARWTDFIARQADQRGWSFHYWEFCAGFGIFDPQEKSWREPLVKALVP